MTRSIDRSNGIDDEQPEQPIGTAEPERIVGPIEIEGEPAIPPVRGASAATAAAPAEKEKRDDGAFRRRVGGVFATRVSIFAIALLVSVVLGRVLGPELNGQYSGVILVPGMIGAFAMFGLPNAANYFAGRGMSVRSLAKASFIFTAIISIPVVTVLWFSLPWLEQTFLSAARQQDTLLRVILFTIPISMLASFGGSILYGRQSVKAYNAVQVCNSLATLFIAIVIVGVLKLGVPGAVAGTVAVSVGFMIAVMTLVARLERRDASRTPASLGELGRYGMRVYPGSITGYFHYRADTLILQAVLGAGSAAPFALYSKAVTLAELVFYIPDSVTTIFLPRVAGLSHDEANRALGRVGRLTMLVTLICAVALIPAAFVGVHLVLPAFSDCLPAFYVILPGTVALSVAKVTSSYLNGRGRPGRVSFATGLSLVVNVAANIVLIPRYGIVGASLASAVSYTISAVLGLYFASRLSGLSPLEIFVPRRAEVSLVWAGTMSALRSMRARARRTRAPISPSQKAS